ncbi:hypothetical protein FRC01_003748 [Tulasnella sp. 417]|nr:hypothetical protein FRC01_003748 [Tulasnella sp. 417]
MNTVPQPPGQNQHLPSTTMLAGMMDWPLSSLTAVLHLMSDRDGGAPKVTSPSISNALEYQRNSTLAQMPEDILILILDCLDKTSQFRLARTCRYLQHLLEGVLYHHIILDCSISDDQTARLHRTLVNRPSLIPLIRRYHGELMSRLIYQEPRFLERYTGRKTNRIITEAEALGRAVSIFTRAANIVDLNFIWSLDWTSESNPSFKPIRLAVAKMSLKRLTLSNCTDVGRILRNQPELEELEIGEDTSGVLQLEETDLPKLRSLTAPLQEAAFLVPGRPIEKIRLIQTIKDKYNFDDRLFKKLSYSTRPVIEFSVSLIHRFRGEKLRAMLQLISQNLPQVERLTILETGRISGRLILEELPAFGSLRSLNLLEAYLTPVTTQRPDYLYELDNSLPSGMGSRKPPNMEDWDDVFHHLRQLCPSLVNTMSTPHVPRNFLEQ